MAGLFTLHDLKQPKHFCSKQVCVIQVVHYDVLAHFQHPALSDIFPKADISSERGETLLGKLALRRNILMLNGADWKAQRKVCMQKQMSCVHGVKGSLNNTNTR